MLGKPLIVLIHFRLLGKQASRCKNHLTTTLAPIRQDMCQVSFWELIFVTSDLFSIEIEKKSLGIYKVVDGKENNFHKSFYKLLNHCVRVVVCLMVSGVDLRPIGPAGSSPDQSASQRHGLY